MKARGCIALGLEEVKEAGMFDPDVEDFLGSGQSTAAPPRPSKAKPAPEIGAGWEDKDIPDLKILKTADLQDIVTGVSVPTLMQIFKVGKRFIDDSLKGVRPINIGKNGARYYDLAEAASFLVAPKSDLARFVLNMDPDDLPDQLRVPYWNAKLKRAEWEKISGFLWDTSEVMDMLERNFMTIKTSTQQFMDSIEGKYGLTDDQRIGIQDLVSDMMREIRADLDKARAETATLPISESRP